MKDIGPLIKAIRVFRGIGANEIAILIGVDSGNYSKFERGGGRLKLPDTLYPIAKVLKTNVPAIFILLEKSKKDKTILNDGAALAQLLTRIHTALAQI